MSANLPVEIDQIFGGLNPSDDLNNWFVIHTKPRQEKKLAKFCLFNKINYFLPLQSATRVYQRRKVTFTKPVFPGYLFLKSSAEQRNILYSSGAIVRFLRVPSEEELLADLNNIYSLTSQLVPLERHPYLKEGYKVRVLKGAFIGAEGIVIDSENPEKVIIGIHIIQQAVCITVKPDDLEVIGKVKSNSDF